ncbi:related to MAK5 - ATP-dependent RNA helicase [Ustilago bromivora]|uniref:ATP-dependent RNA helicase n=1 Tax=Ustilago bromivora TaxID=307758 RepID=A0A8H8QPB0_9BASI|nr:related to MAK5 - ATP-dependent RNA helicase [Ustilago bromivora]
MSLDQVLQLKASSPHLTTFKTLQTYVMVKSKSKSLAKAHSAPSAKRSKKSHNKPSSSSQPSTAKQERKAVDPTTLAWSTVHLPSEAQSGGAGVTESDYFHTLDWNGDDFMGLQEIDHVDVLQEERPDGSRTISFLASEKMLKDKRKQKQGAASSTTASAAVEKQTQKRKAEKNKKRSIEEVLSDVEPETIQGIGTEVGHFTTQAEDESNDEYETAADVTMPAADDAVEDQDDDDDDSDLDLDDDDLAEALRNAHQLDLQDDQGDVDEFDDQLLPAWSHLPLHPALKRALAHKGFTKPTEIQDRSLPFALGLQSQQEAESSIDDSDEDAKQATATSSSQKKRDVVGVSQTGSGKTLAYGLAILNHLFENAENAIPSSSRRNALEQVPPPLGALILCPTRELALQVSSHLTEIVRASCIISADDDDDQAEISHKKLLRRPQIAVVCGGMSEQKQRRLLQGRSRATDRKSGVDIIIATPGRLWEMTRLDDHLAARIKQTRFLVLDEADRMVQVGHFAEMEHILNLVNRTEARHPVQGKDGQQHQPHHHQSDSESEREMQTHRVKPSCNMQTFIFSATLSKTLQINLKKRRKLEQFTKKRHSKRNPNSTTLDELVSRIDLRDPTPAFIDLTPAQGMPEGLMQTKLESKGKGKGGGGVKNCILLATDVAARGLDIPSVDHVVHYQLPRSADTYIHRSGRTARAGSSGVSLALIEPKEKLLWGKLCRAFSSKPDMPSFPITFSTLALLRERVELALKIDKQTHMVNKQTHDSNWLAKLAEDADIDLEEEDVHPDAPTSSRKGARGAGAGNLNQLKSKLAELLSRPVTTKGLSHRYLTANGVEGSGWVEDLMNAETSHSEIVGVRPSDAIDDVLRGRQINPKRNKQKVSPQKMAKKNKVDQAPVAKNKVKAKTGNKKTTNLHKRQK